MNNFKLQFLIFVLGICFISIPRISYAYTLTIEKTNHVGVYVVSLDTEGLTLNALSGTVFFNDTLPEAPTIILNNSIVPLWVKTPTISGNSVGFSGVMPGGFSQLYDQFGEHPHTKATLFTLAFPYEKDISELTFSFDNCLAYSNDGKGTAQSITTHTTTLALPGDKNAFVDIVDTVPPEPFSISAQSIDDFLDGRYFVSFHTTDSLSGVAKYYVRENDGPWVMATSPFVVTRSGTPTVIFVKAVDGFGNERIASTIVPAQKPYWYSFSYLIIAGVVLLSGMFGLSIFIKKRYTTT